MKFMMHGKNFREILSLSQKSHFACLSLAATTGILLGTSQIALAQDAFGNDGIQFDRDTIIEFEFIESHGAYQSTFGVIDLDSCQVNYESIDFATCERTPLIVEERASDLDESVARRSTYEDNTTSDASQDFLGTPGNAVPNPLAEFKFEAGKRYAFYLESAFNGTPAGIVYSSNLYNPGGNRQALFTSTLAGSSLQARRRNTSGVDFSGNETLDQLVNGGLLIRWDDTGSVLVNDSEEDNDYDDVVIAVGGVLDCQ